MSPISPSGFRGSFMDSPCTASVRGIGCTSSGIRWDIVGVISAFNFPVAVWAWNAMIAAVCGDCVLWRPSSETPLTAIAVQKICNRVLERHNLKGIFNLVIGPSNPIGEALVNDRRIPLVSFTGSTEVGRRVSETVARRLGRTILELGGNNGLIVMDDANLDLALRAVVFGAVGTAGQRAPRRGGSSYSAESRRGSPKP